MCGFCCPLRGEPVVASQAGDVSQIHPSELKLTAIRKVHYILGIIQKSCLKIHIRHLGSIVTVLLCLCFVRVPKSFQV